MEGKSDIQSILLSNELTKELYASDPASWEAFVLKLFENNRTYKKASDLPDDGGCLIIVPDQRRGDKTTVSKLMDCSTIISNLNVTDTFDYHQTYATVASTAQLKLYLRRFPEQLNKFRKFYLFRHDLCDLIKFYDLSLFQNFDKFHLVDFKMHRN